MYSTAGEYWDGFAFKHSEDTKPTLICSAVKCRRLWECWLRLRLSTSTRKPGTLTHTAAQVRLTHTIIIVTEYYSYETSRPAENKHARFKRLRPSHKNVRSPRSLFVLSLSVTLKDMLNNLLYIQWEESYNHSGLSGCDHTHTQTHIQTHTKQLCYTSNIFLCLIPPLLSLIWVHSNYCKYVFFLLHLQTADLGFFSNESSSETEP